MSVNTRSIFSGVLLLMLGIHALAADTVLGTNMLSYNIVATIKSAFFEDDSVFLFPVEYQRRISSHFYASSILAPIYQDDADIHLSLGCKYYVNTGSVEGSFPLEEDFTATYIGFYPVHDFSLRDMVAAVSNELDWLFSVGDYCLYREHAFMDFSCGIVITEMNSHQFLDMHPFYIYGAVAFGVRF